MGPFKHTVDDGLDLRKAAFECMYTLMETCLDQLNVFQFLSHIEDGLKDHYDIRVSWVCAFWEGCFLQQYIIESVDSISRDEPDSPSTQYITNAGISRARYTITHFKHHHRVLRLISN